MIVRPAHSTTSRPLVPAALILLASALASAAVADEPPLVPVTIKNETFFYLKLAVPDSSIDFYCMYLQVDPYKPCGPEVYERPPLVLAPGAQVDLQLRQFQDWSLVDAASGYQLTKVSLDSYDRYVGPEGYFSAWPDRWQQYDRRGEPGLDWDEIARSEEYAHLRARGSGTPLAELMVPLDGGAVLRLDHRDDRWVVDQHWMVTAHRWRDGRASLRIPITARLDQLLWHRTSQQLSFRLDNQLREPVWRYWFDASHFEHLGQEVAANGKEEIGAYSGGPSVFRTQSGKAVGSYIMVDEADPSYTITQDSAAAFDPVPTSQLPEPLPPMDDVMKRQVTPDRRYDEHTFLVAHNAYANREDGWTYSQQSFNISNLLENQGVRGLELDVELEDHNGQKDLYLCHGSCGLSSMYGLRPLRRLADALAEVVLFLNDPANAGEVVTVFLEVSAGYNPDHYFNGRILQALEDSGAIQVSPVWGQGTRVTSSLVFWPDAPKDSKLTLAPGLSWDLNPSRGSYDWPTIQQMINKGQRLVLFIDRNQGQGSTWANLPFTWRYVRESDYSNQDHLNVWYSDSSCDERGESTQRSGLDPRGPNRTLLRMNHFPASSVTTFYGYANRLGRLLRRAQSCARTFSLVPNFVVVDYVETGGALQLVDGLNTKVWSNPMRLQALANLAIKHNPASGKEEL